MPAHASPFKLNRKIASGEDRFRMVQLAVEDNEHLEASDFESASDQISYTADTMRMLEEIYPEDQLFSLPGGFHSGDRTLEGLRRASSPLSVSRGRTPWPPTLNWRSSPSISVESIRRTSGSSISKADISSTEIRERSRANQSIKH